LPSFGEKLKQEREKRKITLEQISSSTKIGTRMLQALEEDNFNQLPGGIFNKGFVRAYSRFLGLDEDQTVAEYLQASGDAAPASTEIAAREDEARENEQNISRLEAISDVHSRQLPWGLLAALLLLIALALSLWSYRQRESARQSQRQTPTAAAMRVPAAPVSAEASGKLSNSESVSGASTTTTPTTGAPANSPPAAGSTSTGASGTRNAVTAVPAQAPGEFTVVIQAREESWISITADGKTVPSEVLAAGSERTIHGRKEIVIKAGNAGGIDFRFNGKNIATGGQSGEVKTVTFGPAGMLPASPAPPASP
jgi:cytoskeleton protein RodZ